MQLNPYIMFNGDCKAALDFYSEALGAKVLFVLTYGQTPAAEHTPPELRDKIIHARFSIGGYILMGSDAPPERYDQPKGFSVSIGIDTPEEAERIFAALSDGATIHMPIEETFWAQRFGMLVDKFGIPWMINCEKPS
jgi:PhnB protein